LPKDAKKIKGTLNWCTPDGIIYGQDTRMVPNRWRPDMKTPTKHYMEYFKNATTKNQGYIYVTLKYINPDGTYTKKTRRAHIVIAETFLDNPNNLPVVGHKNNIKTDNRLENLYWTTYQENTKKAVADGLLVNDKGYDDSQSKPVIMYDTYTNKELGRYGSISEAARITGCPKTTIGRQAKYKRPVRKPWYFRYQDEFE
jgi:hypothetical protein